MGALYYPAPSFPSGFLFDLFCFFSPCSDMRSIAELVKNIAHLVIIVSLIKADALRTIPCWFWMLNRNALDRLFRHFEVVAIRSVNDKANRYAAPVSEQTAFHPRFPAICGIRTAFFPPRAVTLSSLRPLTANPNLYPSGSRSGAILSSISCGILQSLPIAGIADGRLMMRTGLFY